MGRKKVTINNNPLEPQTIGTIKKHDFSFITLIIVMVIFGALIFYLPDIYNKFVKEQTSINTNIQNKTNNEQTPINDITDEEEVQVEYNILNTDKSVSFTDISFENIEYDNSQIKYTIVPSNEGLIKLYNENYFINIYNQNKELIKTVFIYDSINGRTTKSISISDAFFYNIVSLKDSEYPYFILDADENEISNLICKKGTTTLTYTFTNEVLTSIEEVITINNPNDSVKGQYNNLKNSYEMFDGVSIIIDEDVYRFTVKVDSTTYSGNIKPYYFDKSASAREIKYKVESMNFTCGG